MAEIRIESVSVAKSATDLTPCVHAVFVRSYLLSLGADPELENECGEKPADLIEPDNKELLELFGLAAADD